jgi:hypothetical protein
MGKTTKTPATAPAATVSTTPAASVSATATTATPSAPAPAVATFARDVHNAAHQVRLLREAVQSDKVRIGYFIGAGCPLGIYDDKDDKSLWYIPIVTVPNVEHILSEIRTLCGRRGVGDVDGVTKVDLQGLDSKICDFIAQEVGKSLPAHRCAYHRFASWVGGLQRIAPVEIFTPNYDLLLEEAFELQGVPHFDGFVGSREPFFDIASIEQDSIPSRWTRLWKLHGSINWQKRVDGTVFRVAGKAKEGSTMIYPSHLKYDQSRRMPYLAMLDRLKAFLRSGGHSQGFGPPVLIVCGYSFADDHLNEVLLDGLRGNRSAQCFVLAFGSLAEIKTIVSLAQKQPNLSVIAKDGAVIGTRTGLYRGEASPGPSADTWIVTEKKTVLGFPDPKDVTNCRLGDFHYLCLLLEQLCAGMNDDDSKFPS